MSKYKAKTTCRECDDANPHPWILGNKRALCDACGYESHWIEGTYDAQHKLVSVNGGYQADWRDGEYDVEPWSDILRDDQSVRITLCCYAPVRHDLKRARR